MGAVFETDAGERLAGNPVILDTFPQCRSLSGLSVLFQARNVTCRFIIRQHTASSHVRSYLPVIVQLFQPGVKLLSNGWPMVEIYELQCHAKICGFMQVIIAVF